MIQQYMNGKRFVPGKRIKKLHRAIGSGESLREFAYSLALGENERAWKEDMEVAKEWLRRKGIQP